MQLSEMGDCILNSYPVYFCVIVCVLFFLLLIFWRLPSSFSSSAFLSRPYIISFKHLFDGLLMAFWFKANFHIMANICHVYI